MLLLFICIAVRDYTKNTLNFNHKDDMIMTLTYYKSCHIDLKPKIAPKFPIKMSEILYVSNVYYLIHERNIELNLYFDNMIKTRS